MAQHITMLSDEILCTAIFDKDALAKETREHIEQCTFCQQRLAEYEQLHKHLLSSLYRRTCPSSMQLSLYCTQLVSASEAAHIAVHISDCVLCAAEVKDTRQFFKNVEGIV